MVQGGNTDRHIVKSSRGYVPRTEGRDRMSHSFQVIVEFDATDDVWVTYVPALDWLSTFGESRDEAIANTREAIVGYLEAAAQEGLAVPTATTQSELIELDVKNP